MNKRDRKEYKNEIQKDFEAYEQELIYFRQKYQEQITLALNYIRDNLPEKLKLKEIAKYSALSQFHFNRIFKKVMQKTPFEYITDKRIKKAKSLLENPCLNVTEISMQVGFESVQSFSNLFRKKVGLSPSQYRKKILFKMEAQEGNKEIIQNSKFKTQN
ncbi:MAG: AraC family transcriptional regulator [Pseudomonadota bacterium]